MDGETIERGEGGKGSGNGQKNIGRTVRPETSTHYTGDVTNGKVGTNTT